MVLLEHSPTHLLWIVYGWRSLDPQNLKYLLIGPLEKKFDNHCLKTTAHS